MNFLASHTDDVTWPGDELYYITAMIAKGSKIDGVIS